MVFKHLFNHSVSIPYTKWWINSKLELTHSPWNEHSSTNSPCTRVPLTYLETLLSARCNPRPPWSQVACKLTSPSPFHFPAPNGSPNSIVRSPKMTSRYRLHLVRNRNYVPIRREKYWKWKVKTFLPPIWKLSQTEKRRYYRILKKYFFWIWTYVYWQRSALKMERSWLVTYYWFILSDFSPTKTLN
jgi:hypothetical protein